jgi:hypothetical protein
MAEGITRFFSDPKVILSILALVVSISSFCWSLRNQFDQNRRWGALNAATVEFREGRFKTWREMSKEEAFSSNWGYDPLILELQEAWNKYRLVYFLQLRDHATGAVLPHSNPVFTVAEAQAEARRVGVNSGVALFRAFRPVFVFENGGKIEALDCSIQISINFGENVWKPAFTSNAPVRIPAAGKFNVSFDFALPFEIPVPAIIRFRIHGEFSDIHGRRPPRDLVVGWESQRDYWFYAAGSEEAVPGG